MSAFAGVLRPEGGLTPSEPFFAAPSFRSIGQPPGIWRDTCYGVLHVQASFTPQDLLETQPIVSASGWVVAGTARLTDRTALAEALAIDEPAASVSDGSLILRAIERWDREAPNHLTGQFGFAAWHTRERRLLLCRDRRGSRALFYFAKPGLVVFGSTLPSVLAHPEVPCRLDEAFLGRYLTYSLRADPARLPFVDISPVPPGSTVMWRENAKTVDRYWQISLDGPHPVRPDAEVIEEARALLDRCVADALVANGPVSTMLSGGFDSSGVTATAARLLAPRRLAVLTRIPSDGLFPEKSERDLAGKTAAAYSNIDWHIVAPELGSSAAVHDVEARFRATGFPGFASAHDWLDAVGLRARELGSRVVLAADSGNLTLSYDGLQYLTELLSAGRLLALWREARETSRELESSPVTVLRKRIGPLVAPQLRRFRQWRDPSRADLPHVAINPSFARQLRLGAYDRAPRPGHDTQSFRRSLLTPAEFARAGSAKLMIGVEFRDPLADLRMIEFCLSLHPTAFLRHGTTRWLARRVLADRVPAAVLAVRRRVGQHPEWFASLSAHRPALAASLDQIASSPMCARVLDLPRLTSLLRDFPARQPTALPEIQAYRHALPRALHLGRFIQWAESGCR